VIKSKMQCPQALNESTTKEVDSGTPFFN